MHKKNKKPVGKVSEGDAFNARILAYMGDETKLLKKHGLRKKPVISYPDHEGKRAPLLGRLGMSIVRAAGGILDTMYLGDNKK